MATLLAVVGQLAEKNAAAASRRPLRENALSLVAGLLRPPCRLCMRLSALRRRRQQLQAATPHRSALPVTHGSMHNSAPTLSPDAPPWFRLSPLVSATRVTLARSVCGTSTSRSRSSFARRLTSRSCGRW